MACMSSLVSTLAEGYGAIVQGDTLPGLCEQAFELASPIPDYEEAAIQAGWHYQGANTAAGKLSELIFSNDPDADPVNSWEEACEVDGIEPYDREVFEHWAVTPWLAEKLAAYDEKVDTDFAGLNVWARTTTGQAIYADGVIERIYADMMKGV